MSKVNVITLIFKDTIINAEAILKKKDHLAFISEHGGFNYSQSYILEKENEILDIETDEGNWIDKCPVPEDLLEVDEFGGLTVENSKWTFENLGLTWLEYNECYYQNSYKLKKIWLKLKEKELEQLRKRQKEENDQIFQKIVNSIKENNFVIDLSEVSVYE